MIVGVQARLRSALARAGWFEITLALQVALGAVVVGIGIGSEPFWRDEAASVSISDRSFAGIFDVLGDTDANSGLYYLLLHIWMWGGDSEGWVRIPSALCALATIPVTALLARRLFDDRVGIAAGFLLALNAFVVIYAQTARGYALVLLLSTVSTLLFVEAASKDRPSLYVGYAVASILAVYVSLFAGLAILAHLVSLPFLPKIRSRLRSFAVAYGAILLATCPLAIFLLTTASDQVSWIERPGLLELERTGRRLLGGEERLLAVAYGGLGLIGLAAAWFAARRPRERAVSRERWRLVLLAGWAALPVMLLFVLSQAKPLFLDHYLISVVPALAILAAVGLVWVGRRSRPLAALAAVLLLALSLVARAKLEPVAPEDLRAAADSIASEAEPEDGIGYAPAFTRVGLEWYLEREDEGVRPVDFGVAPGGQPEQVGHLYARELLPAELVERLGRFDRIWLVSYPGSDWHPTPEPMLDAGIPVLSEQYTRIRADDFDGVLVELYTRNPRPATP